MSGPSPPPINLAICFARSCSRRSCGWSHPATWCHPWAACCPCPRWRLCRGFLSLARDEDPTPRDHPFSAPIDARGMAGRTHLSECLFCGCRHVSSRRRARWGAQCRQGRVVFTRNGNVRNWLDVFMNIRQAQGLLQHSLALVRFPDRARKCKQDNGKSGEQTDYHAKGIEKLCI